MRQKEFVIMKDSIQEVSEVCPLSQQISIQYEDRLDALEPMAAVLGGTLKKKSLNPILFNLEMRTLAYIMLSKLYLVTNVRF